MNLLLVSINLTVIGCIGLVAYYVILRKQNKQFSYADSQGDNFDFDYAVIEDARKPLGLLVSILSPIAELNKFLLPPMMKRKCRKTLVALEINLKPEEFFALQEFLAAVLMVVSFILLKGVQKIELWVFLVGLLGFFAPAFLLKRMLTKRRLAIVRSLPYVVDLLTLAVGAGLDFMVGMRWIIEKANIKDSAMVKELVICLRQIQLGRSRKDALKHMSLRLDIPEVTSFTRTLIQSDRMGTSVEESFRILSEETRRRRFQRGERLALQAPLKMLIPLIFCILPTVMIIITGPVLLQFMHGKLKF